MVCDRVCHHLFVVVGTRLFADFGPSVIMLSSSSTAFTFCWGQAVFKFGVIPCCVFTRSPNPWFVIGFVIICLSSWGRDCLQIWGHRKFVLRIVCVLIIYEAKFDCFLLSKLCSTWGCRHVDGKYSDRPKRPGYTFINPASNRFTTTTTYRKNFANRNSRLYIYIYIERERDNRIE